MRRLLVAVVVLLLLAVGADRAAVYLVQRNLASQVQREEKLGRPPAVAVHGLPFLTQAVRGRYDGATIDMRNLHRDRLPVQRLTVDLSDARLPLRTLLSGSVDAVPVRTVKGNATIAYADLAKATKIAGLRLTPRGDRLELSLPITQFGATLQLVVSARVGVRAGELQITDGQVQGLPLPASVVDAALSQLSSALPLRHLPYGLLLTGVRVASGGLQVSALAHNVVLRRTA